MTDTYPGLFWGYLFIWGLIVVYVLWLARRVSALERSLQDGSQKSSTPDNAPKAS